MADCNQTLRELQTYLDGELPPQMQIVVDEHLLECTDCLQAFDFHAELKSVIAKKAASEPLPAGLLERIQACFGVDSDELAAEG
jgi:mycothiol system anti-sigma-R factor